MTTPLQIIMASMKDAGFLGSGESPSDEDVNDAFNKLNWMIDEWSQQRTAVFHLVEKVVTTTGSSTYTVGPGGQFDMARRPSAVHSAVWRQTPGGGTPMDFPLDVIDAYQDYQRVTAKLANGPPQLVFLDTNWPTGTLYVWPVPPASIYQLRLLFSMVLSQFTSLVEEISLPPAYESAINWNLAKRLLPSVGEVQPNPLVVAMAKSSFSLIQRTNAQPRRLRMPFGIPRRGSYNGYTGTWT